MDRDDGVCQGFLNCRMERESSDYYVGCMMMMIIMQAMTQ